MKTLYILLAWFCFGCGFLLSGASPAADKKAGEAAALAQQAETRLQQAASRQDFQEVAKLLNQAARLDRKNLDVQFKLGWVYLDKLHDPHAAYPHLAKVVASRPDDANATKLFALACSQTGHPRTAVAQFRRASLLQPDDLWVRANLGRSLARL